MSGVAPILWRRGTEKGLFMRHTISTTLGPGRYLANREYQNTLSLNLNINAVYNRS